MLIGSQLDFDAARLEAHCERLFGHADIGNGTSAGTALAAALLADAQTAGESIEAVLALTVDQLEETVDNLELTLADGRHGFQLPLGTKVKGIEPGGVSIGGRDYVLDAGRAGLHPLEETRRDAYGPDLELLRHLISRGTRKLACRRLGLPVAKTIVINDERTLLQFAPCAEAGGIVLQRDTGESGALLFCAAMPNQIAELAASIIADMRVLWKRRAEIGRWAGEVKRAAEAGILEECGPGADLHVAAIAVNMRLQHDHAKPTVYIEYEGLDEALRRGTMIDLVFVPSDAVSWELRRVPRTHRYRTAKLAEPRSAGANGWIDEVAAAIAAASPEGAAAVLARLADSYETLVKIPTSGAPFFASLCWRDGVIEAAADIAGRLGWYQHKLELRGLTLPDTVLTSLAGRPVSEFFDLPFHCNCKIRGVENEEGVLKLTLQVEELLIDCVAGRIFPAPQDEAFGEA